jgi:cell division protein FtsB
MPRAMRHDLSELPYSPTIWQRIGGPWSITLRAYLWTAPLGILAQPVVEPSFWNDFGTLPLWLLSAGLGYLTFGVVLWLGWFIFIDRRRSAFTSPLLVISIAIAASMARSATIGSLTEPLNLDGVGSLARLPFGAFLGFAWVFTTSLIMDSKYRYQLHLDSLVSEQVELLHKNGEWIDQVRLRLNQMSRELIEDSHRHLQQAMREIAILSNDPKTIWAKVTPEIKRASIRIALAEDHETLTSEKNLSELKGSRSVAFTAIATTPLMNVPLVMTFTSIITFLGATRLYSTTFALSAITFGILLHIAIIQLFRYLITRNPSASTFRYFLMISILLVTSLLSTTLVSPIDYDLLILRTIAVTATVFEVVWLIATGFIQYGQLQRQKTIDRAKAENETLELSLIFWQENISELKIDDESNKSPLLEVAAAMNRAVVTQDLQLGLEAMAFSNLYFAEFAGDILGQDAMVIESELGRIARTWKNQAEVIWSVSGDHVELAIARRVTAALEICVSKAIRHGEASVISVDVKRLNDVVEIKVSDNGHDYVEGDSGLGVEILKELSGNTWQRERAGGLNIVTALFS